MDVGNVANQKNQAIEHFYIKSSPMELSYVSSVYHNIHLFKRKDTT